MFVCFYHGHIMILDMKHEHIELTCIHELVQRFCTKEN